MLTTDATPKSSRSLKVGSRVTFTYGLSTVRGVVIEDRGNLGVGGRHLFRIRFELDGAAEPFETELAASELHLAA